VPNTSLGIFDRKPARVPISRKGWEQPSGSAGESMPDRDIPGSRRAPPRSRWAVVAVAEHRDIDEVSRRGILPDLRVDVRQIDPLINPAPTRPGLRQHRQLSAARSAAGTRSRFARLAPRGSRIRTPLSHSAKSGRPETRHIGFRIIGPAQAVTHPGGGPEVRIHLPPAVSLLRTPFISGRSAADR
jgi:hypothetical protein